jgi:hypothetical protein
MADGTEFLPFWSTAQICFFMSLLTKNPCFVTYFDLSDERPNFSVISSMLISGGVMHCSMQA